MILSPLSLESPAVTHWLSHSTALGGVVALLVCLGLTIRLAASYRRRANAWNAKAADLATDLLEEKQKCKEMTHEADYWRGLVKWKQEHTDRDPVPEEMDAMWENIVAQKPQFVAPHPVTFTPLGEIATYSTLDDLTRAKP